MNITLFDGAKDTVPFNSQIDFEELATLIADQSGVAWPRVRKLDRPAMIFGKCEGSRSNGNMRHLDCCAGDIDLAPDDPRYRSFDDVCDWLDANGFAYIAHSTTSSRAAHNKFRLILPYPCPVARDVAGAAWGRVNALFGGAFDPSTKDPARLSFLPALWEGPYRDGDTLVAIDDPNHAFRSNVIGKPILSVADIAALVAMPVGKASGAGRCYAPTPAKLLPAQLNELARGRAANWLGWKGLADIDRSPLVSRRALTELPTSEGSREYRFCKSVVGTAIARGYPVDHATVVALATDWARIHLNRCVAPDIGAQAHNALAWCWANKNPAA